MTKMKDYHILGQADIAASISALNVHDHLKGKTVEELKEITVKDQKSFGVCILNVTGELNTGTIIRNAHLTGARNVAVLGRRKYDKRGTVGAENYTDVERIAALDEDGLTITSSIFWDWMNKNNYRPFFIEHGGTLLHKIDWYNWIMRIQPQYPCLVFGNENRGVPDHLLHDTRGRIISLNQKGVIRSYNVSSASGIVMYDMLRGMKWW